MGSYIPSTVSEREAMLASLGISSADELFSAVPDEVRLKGLGLPDGISESELRRTMEAIASKNTRFPVIYRGAGAYHHYIPSIVKSVSSNEKFLTAYTPYQAEINQGVLQSIFEYQTMICELTGMDVSNASVYDGAVAAAEAIVMCQDRRRSRALVSAGINPETLKVVETYCDSRNIALSVLPLKDGVTDRDAVSSAIGEDSACLLFQQPNYYGLFEDADALTAVAHGAGAKCIMSVNPIALGLMKTPGECAADIAVGEGQALGLPLSFGGPYLGFMACRKELMRKLPGRIVGQTSDAVGNRAFVLTLQAREQHIRREKSSSSICSNQALCALTSAVYMASMGPDGMAELAELCMSKSHYAAEKITQTKGFSLVYEKEFFHEFVTTCPIDSYALEELLAERGILGPLPLNEKKLLWCVTELNSKVEIDALAAILEEVCGI